MSLTNREIESKKHTPKAQKLFDGGGLFLYLPPAPSKNKIWRLKYRFAGKEKLLTIGAYPEVSLLAARGAATEAKLQVKNGQDPSVQKMSKKSRLVAGSQETLAAITEEWLQNRKSRWKPVTYEMTRRRLDVLVLANLGSRPIRNITSKDLKDRLKKVLASGGSLDACHRVLQNCHHIYNHAIVAGMADRDITIELQNVLEPVEFGHHAALTDPAQVGGLLRVIDGYPGLGDIVRYALKLLSIVFVRPGELIGCVWDEVDFDQKLWCIPASRMKMGLPHIVPLSSQATEIFTAMKRLGGKKYVFRGLRSTSGDTHISDGTLTAALRRMGIDGETHTAHGFRATARTLLDERLKERVDLIEHQLAHKVPDPLGRAYNRTQFLDERRVMMQRYADYLDELRKLRWEPINQNQA